MVKHCYIQDYPENFRGNSLGFHLAINEEQSNQVREIKAHLTWGGWWLTRITETEAFYKLLT